MPASTLHPTTEGFETEAEDVLIHVRSAFAAAIEALPRRISKAQELADALGLKKKLAWQIWRVARSGDAHAVAQQMPGSGGLRMFFDAASAQLPDEVLRSAAQALDRYHRLIDDHAGDRSALQMMLAPNGGDQRAKAEVEYRRHAFLGNSFIYGVQARTQFAIRFVRPREEDDRMDLAGLWGLVDFRRLRSDVSWPIATVGFRQHGDHPPAPTLHQTLDGRPITKENPPLLREFSSTPLPDLRVEPIDDAISEFRIEPGSVGTTGAATIVLGEARFSANSRYARTADETANMSLRVRTPCEVLVQDVFVRRAGSGLASPRVRIYNELGRLLSSDKAMSREPIPMLADAQRLGRGPQAGACPDIPRYPEMVDHAFRCLGWPAEAFDLYRLRIRYPILASNVAISFPLLERPA